MNEPSNRHTAPKIETHESAADRVTQAPSAGQKEQPDASRPFCLEQAGLRGIWHRVLSHPVFMCGFRPFFLLTGAGAVILIAVWLWALAGYTGQWAPAGGMNAWHAHELIYGFGMAAAAGFLLTAVPEFTGCEPPSRQATAVLALIWLLGRLGMALSGALGGLGLVLAAVSNLALAAGLLIVLLPPLWRDPVRRHLGFARALFVLWVVQLGFFVALYRGAYAMPWLYVAVGVFMSLIVMATSRISMRVVNGLIESGRPGHITPDDIHYLARPPRRRLALFTIALCTGLEFVLGPQQVTGWSALAAAAGMLNLLNDWHIGRRLLTRWSLMLYAGYWMVALGYAWLGLAWLGLPLLPSAGRHLLMIGAMGLAILTVMNIAGRIHAGVWLDRRPWLPIAAGALVLAALGRAAAGVPLWAGEAFGLLLASGLVWIAVFSVYLWHAWPVLAKPRTDGGTGCDEPIEQVLPEGGGKP